MKQAQALRLQQHISTFRAGCRMLTTNEGQLQLLRQGSRTYTGLHGASALRKATLVGLHTVGGTLPTAREQRLGAGVPSLHNSHLLVQRHYVVLPTPLSNAVPTLLEQLVAHTLKLAERSLEAAILCKNTALSYGTCHHRQQGKTEAHKTSREREKDRKRDTTKIRERCLHKETERLGAKKKRKERRTGVGSTHSRKKHVDTTPPVTRIGM